MSCKTNNPWQGVIMIGGGIAIGTVAVAAIVAAPLEIATTAVLVAATKMALDKSMERAEREQEGDVDA